ncbi:MAG: 2-dehydro-3-deoxygalactonokinase [Clostridiales Family XIII bacterium]|jgi:2-keto-3-deoxy-galactonokinase|nr:2-dehydro-3-deoxygalactonokinase [Clostridiales Family XIII bacterium]
MYDVYFDFGTSNTRGYLLKDAQIEARVSENTGSKDVSLAGNNAVLLAALSRLYAELLQKSGYDASELKDVYASGMITSPFGLMEVPHLTTPLDAEKLRISMVRCPIDGIFPQGVSLVPGAKTADGPITIENVAELNNLRGEETEAMGICGLLPPHWKDSRYLIIIPGSHTHSLLMENDAIMDILSTFSGEIFHALTQATVLHGGVETGGKDRYSGVSPDAVRLACRFLDKYGLARAIYIIHAMKIFEVADNFKRRAMLSATVVGATVQSITAALREKWQNTANICIYGDDAIMETYNIAFAYFAPKLPKPLNISRERVAANVNGILRIISSGGGEK